MGVGKSLEADNEEDMTQVWFENVETGEKIDFITPEELRRRGVKVQELVLV